MLQWDEIAVKLAGIAGAIASMRFLSGTWTQKITMAVGGAVASFYATPYVVQRLSLPEGLAGFLLGLFGMSILSRTWEWVQTTSLSTFIAGFFPNKPK